MNTKQTLHQASLAKWAFLFKEQAASGLTVKAWCEQNIRSKSSTNSCLAGYIIHADETPLRVIRDGRPAGSEGRMWVYKSSGSDDTHPIRPL